MKQNYFVHNGVKYTSGTQIKLLNYPYNNPVLHDLVCFIYYDTDYDRVMYQMAYNGKKYGCSMNAFLKMFGGATGKVDSSINVPQTQQLKDHQVPMVLIGWGWYIAIMLLFAISKLLIPGWVITSIIFFKWRKKVMREEGSYVKW